METSDPLYSDKENERRRIFGVPSVVVVIYIFSGRMVELFGLQHNSWAGMYGYVVSVLGVSNLALGEHYIHHAVAKHMHIAGSTLLGKSTT